MGESEGRWAVGLQQIRQDLCAYLSFTESPPGREKLPLILYGHSAGGYAALAALSEGYDVDGVISVCGFNSPTDMMMYHSRENVGVLADLEYPFFVLENLFLFGSDASDTALEGINAAEIPILLIEGDSDERFPPSLGLIRYADSFQNPNVEWTTVSAPWRGEHATPWLTEAGAAYVCAWSDSEPPDKEKANELDPDFMNLILDFCDRIIKKDGLQP